MIDAKTLGFLALLALAAAGCAMAPAASLTDASRDGAVVRIGYDVLGPSIEVAGASAALVARDHCEALGKSHELVWSKQEARDRHRGEYAFRYACERAEDRLLDRKAVVSTAPSDLLELARPMIETSHAEARRHRQ